jgi:DNA-binding transcriptional LysR family regulator
MGDTKPGQPVNESRRRTRPRVVCHMVGSMVSQAVRQLEDRLQVVLLTRTTRSVALTDAGRRLVEGAAPALAQAMSALTEVSAKPGETVGRVRLSVPRLAAPFVIDSLLPAFRAHHPRIEVEVDVSDRLVDIVAEGFDAGIRSSDVIERERPGACRSAAASSPTTACSPSLWQGRAWASLTPSSRRCSSSSVPEA